MGFVKTPEEIARIAASLTDIQFRGGHYIGVDFESDPAFIESVLPPGLEPRGNNIMTAAIFDFEGGSAGPFTGTAIYIAADSHGLAGDVTLTVLELSMAPNSFRSGTASLKFNGSVHDPLQDIPVNRVVGAHYIVSDFQAKCRVLATIPGNEFLPYASMDDCPTGAPSPPPVTGSSPGKPASRLPIF